MTLIAHSLGCLLVAAWAAHSRHTRIEFGLAGFDEATLGAKLFGPRPYAEVVIGEIDRVTQGFAFAST